MRVLDICLYSSIRATSQSVVSEWKEITTSALDSKNHTRLDFQLSSNVTSWEKKICSQSIPTNFFLLHYFNCSYTVL